MNEILNNDNIFQKNTVSADKINTAKNLPTTKHVIHIKHVICIKWGVKYSPSDVNILFAMVKRNTAKNALKFHCFTDDAQGLNPEIIAHPLPEINLQNPDDLKYVYRKEVGLCDDALGGLHSGLQGERVFFFDLDVIITDNLDCLFDYPKDDEFVIINDWNSKGDKIGQASCYSWRVGTLGFVKADFEARPKEVVAQYFTASQEYLSAKVIEKYGELKFWPEQWCVSFKQHAIAPWWLRLWVAPKLPAGAKLLAFHGDPKIADAIAGRWAEAGQPFYKKIYKNILPSPWLADYWRE